MIRSVIEDLSEDKLEQLFYDAQEFEKTGVIGDSVLREIAEALNVSSPVSLTMVYIVAEVYRHFAIERFNIVNRMGVGD
jgi:O-phosphoseryl-tRNA(Cys) synthetase